MARRVLVAVLLASSMGVADSQAASDEASARNRRGAELLQRGRVDDAIAEFQRAVKLDPENVSARLNLAYVLDRQGRVDDAIAQYKSAIDRDPTNAVARSNLGVLYDKKGAYEPAIEELEKAAALDPSNAAIGKNLAVARKNKAVVEEREERIAAAKKEVASRPDSMIAAYKLGRAYAVAGDKQQAIAWIDRAFQLGYRDLAYLKMDPALDSIRAEPAFLALIKRAW
jgi:superkiller protein 3